MEKKIEELEKLNYALISFIETILSEEETCVKNGKHTYLKTLFEMEFSNILSKKYEEDEKCKGGSEKEELQVRRVIENGWDIDENDITEVIDIDIPESETESENIKNMEEIIPYEMIGGDEKKVKKGVKIDTSKDKIYEIEKKPGKKDTKKAKIERGLKRLKAEEVKKIGKEFNVKPTKEKKYLTKTFVLDKIKGNTRIYDKVLKYVNENYNDIMTESSNS